MGHPNAVIRSFSPNATKPGWLARLSVCGTGSVNLVSMADPECRNLQGGGANPVGVRGGRLVAQVLRFAQDDKL